MVGMVKKYELSKVMGTSSKIISPEIHSENEGLMVSKKSSELFAGKRMLLTSCWFPSQ